MLWRVMSDFVKNCSRELLYPVGNTWYSINEFMAYWAFGWWGVKNHNRFKGVKKKSSPNNVEFRPRYAQMIFRLVIIRSPFFFPTQLYCILEFISWTRCKLNLFSKFKNAHFLVQNCPNSSPPIISSCDHVIPGTHLPLDFLTFYRFPHHPHFVCIPSDFSSFQNSRFLKYRPQHNHINLCYHTPI